MKCELECMPACIARNTHALAQLLDVQHQLRQGCAQLRMGSRAGGMCSLQASQKRGSYLSQLGALDLGQVPGLAAHLLLHRLVGCIQVHKGPRLHGTRV